MNFQFRLVAQLCPTLCDPMNRSTLGLPIHHQLPEFTQTHVHRVSDAIQPSHPLSSPSPPAPNPFQHQSIFQWVNSLHEVAKVLEFQLQGKPFNITVIQVYAATSNAEEAEVEQFYEDLQDLLELTPKKDVLFIIGDWNAKVGKKRDAWSSRQIWPWSTKRSRAKANSFAKRTHWS